MRVRSAWFGRRQYQAGQTTAEFAVSATVFVILVFALMQLSWTVYNFNTMCSAAREAVRYAIVHSPTGPNQATTAQVQQVAINYAPALNLVASDINVTWPTDANYSPTKDARISISHRFTFPIPFLPSINVTLTTTSQMLVSQ
jgi:Flp pilus assembly protein TadG